MLATISSPAIAPKSVALTCQGDAASADSCTWSLFRLRLTVFTGLRVPLRLDTFLSPLPRCLGLGTFGVHLFLQDTLTLFLGLGFVNLEKVVSV